MTGLEKITERIQAEGREKARLILQEAEQDCTRMASEYAERAETLRATYAERGVSEGEALVREAKAAAEQMHAQIVADAKQAVYDEIMDGAKKKLCTSQQNKYRELMIALLSSALIERDAEERARAEAGESVHTERYEVLMNGIDHDTFGTAVVEGARRLCERRIGANKAARVVLSHERMEIDGGLFLRFDDELVDCSITTLLSRICEQMRPELEELLFGE